MKAFVITLTIALPTTAIAMLHITRVIHAQTWVLIALAIANVIMLAINIRSYIQIKRRIKARAQQKQ